MQLDCKNDINIVLQDGIEVIDNEIFCLCKGTEFIKSIFIPKTVNKIKVGCFMGCYIDNIVIDKDNQTYHCKDNCIIETATNTLIAVGNTFTIPDYVNKIEDRAFAYNDRICNEKLPKAINTIGDEAFSCCNNLKELIITSDCKIGKDAFKGCHNLLIKYNVD